MQNLGAAKIMSVTRIEGMGGELCYLVEGSERRF